MNYTLIALGSAAVLLGAIILWDKHKHPHTPLSLTIRTWPWTDTFLAISVLLTGWTVLFYEGCLVFMQTSSFEPFTAAMQPVFNFLNIMLGSAGITAIGRRATTKVDVIDAHARAGATGEFPAQRPEGG